MKKWRTGDEVYIGDPFGDAVELTDEEYNKLMFEKAIIEQRERRDSLLREIVDAMNPMRWENLTETEKDAWREYRQALLDVPQQPGFPETILWPEKPLAK